MLALTRLEVRVAVPSEHAQSPCIRHGCHACCLETSMSLSEADIRRLTRIGCNGFFCEDQDGNLRLRNVDGHCVFLQQGRCSVYAQRPEGCVLYPLIYYTDCGETGLHEFCDHRHEFVFSQGDRQWLCRCISREEAEIAARVAARG